MLFCGCYHDYVIGPDEYLVLFGVTNKTTLDGSVCLRHELKCIMAFSER